VLRSLAHPAPYPPAHSAEPPAPALLDQLLVEVHATRQDHFSNRALVLVEAVDLKHDFIPKGDVRVYLLAERLVFLWAADAAEVDTFSSVWWLFSISMVSPLINPTTLPVKSAEKKQ
jgi:hypothetical protein